MTKTQLDNLICFSFLFKTINYQEQSPDYIKEKWDSYIGMSIPNTTMHLDTTIKWKDFWNADDTLLSIIDFLQVNGTIAFVKDTPSDMLERFGRIFDIESITNKSYNGLHDVLKMALNTWKESNLRDYNLCLLT